MTFFSGTYVEPPREHARRCRCTTRCAVMALTHPELFTRSFSHVAIETAGEHTRGMTVIDQRTLDRTTGAELRSADRRRRRRGVGRRDRGHRRTSAAEAGWSTAQVTSRRTTVGAMRAAVMRDWQLRVDELPDPTPGPGQVLTKVLGVRHLRQRSAPAAARRGEPAVDERVERRPAARSDAAEDVRAGARHGDGPRVLLRGGRPRRRVQQPEGRRHRRQPARRVRRGGTARRRASPTSTTAATPS